MDTNQPPLAELGARAIRDGFDAYHSRFKRITRRARDRFEARDWHGAHRDALERLDLYGQVLAQVVQGVNEALGGRTRDGSLWAAMKGHYSRLIAGRVDFELAETFFNSVTRRIFTTVGVAPQIEFVDSDFEAAPEATPGPPDLFPAGYHRGPGGDRAAELPVRYAV
jgi:isocitrate dehydrogenase kinase/phosphatase